MQEAPGRQLGKAGASHHTEYSGIAILPPPIRVIIRAAGRAGASS